MPEKINRDNVAIVLKEPQFPENIGAAARAMRNMGIRNLTVVAPLNFDMERVLKMATHVARDIIEEIRVCDDLAEALAEFHYVVGSTARVGGQRQLKSPRSMCRELIPISRENRIALVFGREDRGLSNEDIRLCHALVNIPTDEFSSLNLAQAVMIMCYEVFMAQADEKTEFIPRLANRHELDGMYDQLKDILLRINYLNPENPDYWMHHLRQFFTRIRATGREVSIIRGIIRQMNWYEKKRYQDGITHGKSGK
jgi:tRNA/rRNA methyltransferase